MRGQDPGRRRMKSVCLIGGGGFLGTALRRALAARDCRLTTIGRTPQFKSLPGERYLSVEDLSLEQIQQLVRELAPEVVIDLAHSSVPHSATDPSRDLAD